MSEFLGNKTGVSIVAILFASFLFSALCPVLLATDVFAYTASLSTSGTVTANVIPNTEGDKSIDINQDSVNVITDCRAGYNLTISSSVTDRNLYKDGNSANNTSGQYFTPVNGTAQLNNTTNQYGYSLTANTESGVFTPLPLPSAPTFIKTPSQTASESDINDNIPVYYGTSTANNLTPGLYKMPNNGYILYQLTLDESCRSYTVAFNANGGTGTMTNQDVTVDQATNLKANSFTAPARGQSYQNAAGTTIPATADKMWAFWGWNTEVDGSGDWYKDRESVTNLTNDGDAITLYAQWKQATLADLTASTPGQNKTIDHNTMQDMSSATCWNSDKFTAIGTPYGQATLIDTRDGNTRTYTVARLPDGYCWMTQNLNLGTSTPITLTSNDTDLEEGTTFTLPASNPTDFSTTQSEANYNKATVLNDMTIPNYTVNGTTYSGKVTGYYSYAAATANTSTYSTSSGTEIFNNSICPKNWDLPTNTQYYDLRTKGSIATYNNTSTSYIGKNAGNEPYYFIYGGYRRAAGATIDTTAFYNPTTYGYLWTANNYGSSSGRNTYVYSNGLYNSSAGSSNYKYYGLGIRCVTNMDDAMTKVTFVNTDTNETQTQAIGLIGESNTITLRQHPTAWTKPGYSIAGWDTSNTGTNVVYTREQSVTLSDDITLYTVWKPAYTLQYDGNGADAGVMTNIKHTNVYEGDVFDLFASNYSKAGYGFAGWSFDSNAQPGGTSRIYGPNEAITAPAASTPGETKTLYAIWVQSAGNLQDWNGCASMSIGDVTALKDTRDNQVYTVGKLADDNCWMMENLRLDTAYSSDSTKAQGFGGVFVGLANSETNFSSSTKANSLYTTDTTSTTLNIITGSYQAYRFPRYDNQNTSSRATNPSFTDDRSINISPTSSINEGFYSYGNYYTWAAAMANTDDLSTATTSEVANTSICPSGWKLPYGRSSGNGNTSGGFYYLGTQLGATATDETSARIWRSYPQNIIRSGKSGAGLGTHGYYHSSTAYSYNRAYSLYMQTPGGTTIEPGTYFGNSQSEFRSKGYTIRCVAAKGLEVKLMRNDGTNRVGGRVYGGANSAVALPTSTRDGYHLTSWNTAANGSGTSYTDSYTLGSTGVTLYAQWAPAYTIQYNGNGADAGVMTNIKHTNVYEGDVFDLFASNYSKAGYGFAGWSFDSNAQPGGTSRIYGPNEAITAPAASTPGETKTLYAIWVQSAGNLQDWNGCASMSIGDVTALKDTRDNQVYTVGKLADDNCWMMENLRLDTAYSSDSTKAQGFGGAFVGLADPESANFTTSTTANTLNGNTLYSTANITGSNQGYRFPRYNNSNTGARDASPSVNDNRSTATSAHNTSLSTATYSYGNYYTWAAAKANTEDLTTTATSDVADTSICPKGWKLPYGNSSGNGNTSGGFYYLGSRLADSISNEAASKIWRSYPNNYVYSGYFNTSSVGNRGFTGYYWSSSAFTSGYSVSLSILSTSVGPGSSSGYKFSGYSVRCVAGKTSISQLTYMQDFKNLTSSEKTAVINSMSMGTEYTLIDSRDNETYVIAKLGDGKVWMEDNLRLGDTSSMALTTANTNSRGNFTLPAGTTSGYSETSPYINVSSKNTIATTKWGDGSGKVGVYYNYCAASAGTICSSSNSSDASYDICPAGWRMPTGHTNGEFQALRDAYSDVGNFQREASMLLSGYVKSGTISNYNEFGTAWSSTLGDSTTMHNMIVYSSSFSSTDATQRYNMNPIRCIVK